MSGFSLLLRNSVVACCVLTLCGNGIAAAQNKVGPARFAVDLVTLNSGKRLRGAFLGIDAKGVVTMALQRD